MKRAVKVAALTLAVYVIPLAGAPELILDYKIIVLAVAGALMLLSQPDFTAKDAAEQKSTDRHSMSVILIAGMVSYITPVVEWGYFGDGARGVEHTVATIIGLTLVLGGLGFRIWSIRVLGKFFTATVQIVDGHRVIKHGPYRFVRHPSYLGSFVSIVGAAIALGAPLGVVMSLVTMGLAYALRIAVEEQALLASFGGEYEAYRRKTWRLAPLVW